MLCIIVYIIRLREGKLIYNLSWIFKKNTNIFVASLEVESVNNIFGHRFIDRREAAGPRVRAAEVAVLRGVDTVHFEVLLLCFSLASQAA